MISHVEKLQNVLFKFFHFIKPQNYILFESLPTLSDNTKYVYEALLSKGYNKKYKFIWFADNDFNVSEYPQHKNVVFLKPESNNTIKYILTSIYKTYLYSTAKLIISCNNFLMKTKDSQYYINLAHGEALKNCSNNYNLPDFVDKVVCLSPFLKKYDAINFACDENKLIPLGYPRNDLLFGSKIELNKIFINKTFNKAIYWMPTYRQHKNGLSYSNIAFPIIYNENIAYEINDSAKKENILIIIKPHPAQDLTRIKALELSNLIFIDNNFLNKNSIENYELLRSVDAMISDYSSVYYDYLLCDKPIGLCFDDFEEYNKNEGFTVDPEYILSGGEKIYNTEDMCAFIKRIANGDDMLKEKRNEIRNICHLYSDNQSTKRVVDYIEEVLLKL